MSGGTSRRYRYIRPCETVCQAELQAADAKVSAIRVRNSRFANGGLRESGPIGFVTTEMPASGAGGEGELQMIPRPFEYHAPTSVEAALALLATHGVKPSCWRADTACCR